MAEKQGIVGFVLVEWLDSQATSSLWERRDELEKIVPAPCMSAGFVLEDTKDHLTLTGTINEHDVMGRLTIPRVAITRITALPKNLLRRAQGLK